MAIGGVIELGKGRKGLGNEKPFKDWEKGGKRVWVTIVETSLSEAIIFFTYLFFTCYVIALLIFSSIGDI